MGDIERIVKLLEHDDEEVVSAAALVLGELGARAPAAVDGLLALAESGHVAARIRALGALARIAPPRAEKRLCGLLSSGPAEVRRAAGQALMALGPRVVAALSARVDQADAEERRIIGEVLSGVGGEDAFSTLLGSLSHLDGEEGRRTALRARQKLRALPLDERKRHLAQVKQFLRKKSTRGSEEATVAAIKLLGFLELPEAMPFLVEILSDGSLSTAVRLEAILGLRFALGSARRDEQRRSVLPPLVELIESGPDDLASAAQDTLAFVPLPASVLGRLERLAGHERLGRARFAVQAIASLGAEEATETLARVSATAGRLVAEAAAEALRDRPGAAEALLSALVGVEDSDRAWALARILEPQAADLTPASTNRLVKAALGRLDAGEPGWEALLRVARLVAADRVVSALGERVAAAKRKKNAEHAMRLCRVLCASPQASDRDRFSLALLELAESGLDLKRQARERDGALASLEALASRGFDVAGGLMRERGLSLEALYYVGFHLAEAGEPAGETLLEHVVKQGGRKKIAQAAKNKLKLIGQ